MGCFKVEIFDLKTGRTGRKMQVSDSETTLELNFAVLKLKHTVKRKNKE